MEGVVVDPAEVEWWSVQAGLLSTHVMAPLDALKDALKDDALLDGGEGAWLKVGGRARRLRASTESAKAQLGTAPTAQTTDAAALLTAIFDEAIRLAAKIEHELETPSEFTGFGGFFASIQVIAALVGQVVAKGPKIVKADPPQRARRETMSRQVRNEVWNRDGGQCVDCGSREKLEYDHIIAVANGGSNTARNIELRCETCNRKKGARI